MDSSSNLKRAATSADEPARAKKPRKRKSIKAKEPSKHFDFLALPAELRDLIYDLVAASAGATLRPRSHGHLSSPSGLSSLCKQVCVEYHAALCRSAPITAYVRDLDFSHVITFFNKLAPNELLALPSRATSTDRHFQVHLECTLEGTPHGEGLRRWLNRFKHPTKPGTDVAISYSTPAGANRLPSRRETRQGWECLRRDWDTWIRVVGKDYAAARKITWTNFHAQRTELGSPIGDLAFVQRQNFMQMEEGKAKEELGKIAWAASVPGRTALPWVHLTEANLMRFTGEYY